MSDPVPVLWVHHASVLGGAERSLLDVVRHLDPHRYFPVVCLPHPSPLASALRDAGIQTIHLPIRRVTRTPSGFFSLAWNHALGSTRMAGILQSLRPAIVHANSLTALLCAGPASRRQGIPCLWHCRDLSSIKPFQSAVRRWATGGVIAISDTIARHLASSLGSSLTPITIPNGIDLAPDVPPPESGRFRQQYGIQPATFLVGNIGQLVPWKRHDRFLDAMTRVAAILPDSRFVIAGTDPYNDHPAMVRALQARASSPALRGRVIFTGHLPDIRPLLADLDCLVHTADREPFGRVIVEAMAAGCPVVAVKSGGPAEIIRDGTDGLLVDPADLDAISQSVIRIAQDPLLTEQLTTSARSRARDAYDIRLTATRLMSVYDQLGS
ncbi:MAG: hypothetical protein A2498_12715 [Lentisphaerae bacterium RIFOXYC12_FULL_60_16]|nr:MAG: hypothetical protein A2498_12715 [Lentisphaerae bacterium RIFOXYC12_FULL_60_16]